MKKILKLSVCALSLVASAGATFVPVIKNVNAVSKDTNITIEEIKSATDRKTVAFTIKQMPTKIDPKADSNKEKFFIPTPSVNMDCELTIVVKNGNKKYEQNVDETASGDFEAGEGGFYFKSYKAGTSYKVYFLAKSGEIVYSSSIYNVVVESVGYAFDTDKANSIVDIAGINDKIALPVLPIKDTEEKVVPTVYMNNTKITVDETNSTGDFRHDTTNDVYYLIPSAEAQYTVKYESATYGLSKTYKIDVSKNFDSSKVELKASTLTMSACEVGKEVTFPKASVSDTYNNRSDVNTSTVISIYKNGNLVKTLDENVYAYTFSETGNYTVKYQIKNYYLNNQKTIDIQIGEEVVVEHTQKPEVYFAEDYDTTSENWEENVKTIGDHAVVSVTGYNGFTVPAIYAKDLVTSYDDLKGSFERLLVCGSKTYNIDKASDNAELSEDNTDLTKSIRFAFKDTGDTDFAKNISGTYTLRFIAKDGAGTTTKSLTVKVEAVDAIESTRNTNLSLTLPTSFVTEMRSDDKLTVAVNDAKDDQDTRIETHYYYYYGNKSELSFEDKKQDELYLGFVKPENFVELELDDSKLTLELENYENQSVFTVVAVAINDQGQFVYDAKEVTIKNTADADVPVATKVTDYEKSVFMAGREDVVLPQVRFNDNLDKNLEISVGYYIDSIDNYLASGLETEGLTTANFITDSDVTVTGKLVKPSKAGVYYVVYTAKDDANNIYELITSFEVKKEQNYSLVVKSYDSAIKIYGTSTIVAEVTDSDGNVVDVKPTIEFIGNNPSSNEGNTYTFNKSGDYQFIAKATVYKTLISEPSDFAENYGSYYKLDGSNYVALTSSETFASDTYYTKEVLESNKCSIKVSDVDYEWDKDYDNKYAPDKTTKLSPSEYTVLTSKPADWEENYNKYYVKSGTTYTENADAEWSSSTTYYVKNELVYVTLTPPTATQNGREMDVKITVTDPNGDDVELIDVEDAVIAGTVKFVASKEGQYKVVFSAGEGDKKITKTYTIQVGDANKPNVTIENIAKLQESITYDGRDIKYSIVSHTLNEEKSSNSVNVYNVTFKASYVDGDNEEQIFSYDVELSLYDIDRNGAQIALDWDTAFKKGNIKLNGNTATNNTWTLTDVGENELTISVSDKYGNISEALTIKFNVVEKSNVKEKKDNKAGIILIIISVIILIGLVGFFAFAGKSKTNKAKKAKKVEPVADKKEDKE